MKRSLWIGVLVLAVVVTASFPAAASAAARTAEDTGAYAEDWADDCHGDGDCDDEYGCCGDGYGCGGGEECPAYEGGA